MYANKMGSREISVAEYFQCACAVQICGIFCDLWNRNSQALGKTSEYLTTAKMLFFSIFGKKSGSDELTGYVGKKWLS